MRIAGGLSLLWMAGVQLCNWQQHPAMRGWIVVTFVGLAGWVAGDALQREGRKRQKGAAR